MKNRREAHTRGFSRHFLKASQREVDRWHYGRENDLTDGSRAADIGQTAFVEYRLQFAIGNSILDFQVSADHGISQPA